MIGEDVRSVDNQLRHLHDAGCIEFVGYEGDGNFRRAIYRAIDRPVVSDETYRAMSPEERHELNGVALQWILAECQASYQSRRMDQDENVCLIHDEPNLDATGRQELRELLTASWSGDSEEALQALKGVQEIEARATNRMAKSGETGTTIVVTLLAFERGAKGVSRNSPLRLEKQRAVTKQ